LYLITIKVIFPAELRFKEELRLSDPNLGEDEVFISNSERREGQA